MKSYRKRDYPLAKIRRYLEPGPIVLVSSARKGKTNIMTMGWHMMLGFSPALFGCYIWDGNRSFEMLRRSEEWLFIRTSVETGRGVALVQEGFDCLTGANGEEVQLGFLCAAEDLCGLLSYSFVLIQFRFRSQ